MTEVEIDIFSGRPNPRWQLTRAERDHLLDQLSSGAVNLLGSGVVEARLGYRGVIVHLDQSDRAALGGRPGEPMTYRIRSGVIDEADRIAERWAIETAWSHRVPGEVVEAAEEGVVREPTAEFVESLQVDEALILNSCTFYQTSSTDFSFWNAAGNVTSNNCYNYAANYRTGTFAQPGRAAGSTFTQLALSNIGAAALQDGFAEACSGQNLHTQLYIWPGMDFHFYRRTADVGGEWRWCHKPGQTPATNLDNSGNIITNPITADRGGYTEGVVGRWGPGSSVVVQ